MTVCTQSYFMAIIFFLQAKRRLKDDPQLKLLLVGVFKLTKSFSLALNVCYLELHFLFGHIYLFSYYYFTLIKLRSSRGKVHIFPS